MNRETKSRMKNLTQSILVWIVVLASCFMCQTRKAESIVLESGDYFMEVNKTNLSIRFLDQNGNVSVPPDSVSGVFIDAKPVVSANIIEEKQNELLFSATSSGGSNAEVNITFENGIAAVSVLPEETGNTKVSLRFAGMPVAHGLGDAGGWNKTFDLAGEEEKTFNIQKKIRSELRIFSPQRRRAL